MRSGPLISFIVAALLIPMAQLLGQTAPKDSSLVGEWAGSLAVSGIQLRLVFHIENQDGTLTGTLDSPDQSAYGIKLGEITSRNDSVQIGVPAVYGSFEGLFEDAQKVVGNWHQGGTSLPLTLILDRSFSRPGRPQEPEPPFPYLVKEVNFVNQEVGITLSGTLTMPSKRGAFPAVVLVSGSGPQNRNEEVFGHKPFLVLADHLTRMGIAVLRYDDRGIGKSTGSFSSATSEDFATDALAAFDFLTDQPGVDTSRVGIIGHSEGGLIAPMVATQSDLVDFIVLLAGPGLPGHKILLSQAELISRTAGISEQIIRKNHAFSSEAYDIIKNTKDTIRIASLLKSHVGTYLEGLTPLERQDPGNSSENLLQVMERLNSPWFRFFLTYDPAESLAEVTCPVLALGGKKDLQVPYNENLEAIKSILESSGNTKVTIRSFDNLNHLFQTSVTGAPSEYAGIEETFSPLVLDFVSSWILSL